MKDFLSGAGEIGRKQQECYFTQINTFSNQKTYLYNFSLSSKQDYEDSSLHVFHFSAYTKPELIEEPMLKLNIEAVKDDHTVYIDVQLNNDSTLP